MLTAPYPILVVDDDQDNCELVAEALAIKGYSTRLAASGEQARQLACEQRFSLVISDIQMGTISGIEFLKWFRKRFPTTPVVLVTAYGSAQTQSSAMNHGAFHYLTKPINLDELLFVVSQALLQDLFDFEGH